MDNIAEAVAELLTDKATDIEASKLEALGPRSLRRRLSGLFAGWRTVVIIGAVISATVLTGNIALLAWAEASHGSTANDGVLTVFDGSCSESQTAFLWSHLAINIAGSLLLACSNAACQLLSAPTRADIDEQHRAGRWLDIGIPSFRNLRWVSLRKRIFWILLASSSVPLHLLYNSVLFPTTSANEYVAVVAPSNFLLESVVSPPSIVSSSYTGWVTAWTNEAINPDEQVAKSLHERARKNDTSLERLTSSECFHIYSQTRVSEYRNVLVITNGTNSNGTIYGSVANGPLSPTQSRWTCIGAYLHAMSPQVYDTGLASSEHAVPYAFLVNEGCTLQSADSWLMIENFYNPGSVEWNENYFYGQYVDSTEGLYPFVAVDHCLAERTEPSCTIRLSRSLLVVVIVANMAKLVCFIFVISWANDKPLVTIGDSITSFLTIPDSTTTSMGALSALEVRNGVWPSQGAQPRSCNVSRRFWYRAASWKRWIVTSSILLLLYTITIFLCVLAASELPASQYWSAGFGAVDVQLTITVLLKASLLDNVLLANMPQLLLSLCYVFYNNILTSSLLAAEYADYANHRKPLRVSTGSRSQRSTYWLQVPYRYAVPLLASFTGLHWLSSQSIFLANIQSYSALGYRVPAGSISACGYSPIAVIFCTIVGGLLVVLLYANGFRRLPAGMPLVGSCSAAISAACHAGADEGNDMVEWPLMYGVLRRTGVRRKLFKRNTGELVRQAVQGRKGARDAVDARKRREMDALDFEERKDGCAVLARADTEESGCSSDTASEVTGKQYRRVGFSSWEVEPLVQGEIYQ